MENRPSYSLLIALLILSAVFSYSRFYQKNTGIENGILKQESIMSQTGIFSKSYSGIHSSLDIF